MTIQTNIPRDLSDPDRTAIFQNLDTDLNSRILYSLLNGIYTGIVAVTLWNIFMDKSRAVGRAMVVLIILLYIVTTVDFALIMSNINSVFVDHGQSFRTENVFYESPGVSAIISTGVASTLCTILADSTMIWRCWTVWGQRWLIILLPALFLVCAVVFKLLGDYEDFTVSNSYILGFVLYSSFLLATNFLCTFLIVYRIITVARVGGGGSGVRAYRRIIEVLVESYALYSMSLVLYVAFYARDAYFGPYFDILAAIARGIAPTILVGRVAAGHARPDDSWQGSAVLGSLRFGTRLRGQNSTMSGDVEAERERHDKYGHRSVAESQENIDISSEDVIGNNSPEVELERPADSHLNNENGIRGDAQQDSPEGNLSGIFIVSRD
ncbi:uncharacterized protein BT62DRAFT_926024 [Guyanagaster necrorhizus]|uniref:Uncharacterized protein n=1 Tax=Guyanagaster necrorhizus TaxID=856835 RepID=A0A9P7W386_9AGAR|nr:uncharacterized protein BT62DRAFT_926024 [Guyanagaster necrorhizus MCA 3950]KAG7451843.1 hypothetical protein BT62DRAFT_926024 [Guyanagaster necrorhizus MCA 3950]